MKQYSDTLESFHIIFLAEKSCPLFNLRHSRPWALSLRFRCCSIWSCLAHIGTLLAFSRFLNYTLLLEVVRSLNYPVIFSTLYLSSGCTVALVGNAHVTGDYGALYKFDSSPLISTQKTPRCSEILVSVGIKPLLTSHYGTVAVDKRSLWVRLCLLIWERYFVSLLWPILGRHAPIRNLKKRSLHKGSPIYLHSIL